MWSHDSNASTMSVWFVGLDIAQWNRNCRTIEEHSRIPNEFILVGLIWVSDGPHSSRNRKTSKEKNGASAWSAF